MEIVSSILHHLHLVETAHAVTVNQVGFWQSDAVRGMWTQICDILPFCLVGADAPRLLSCKIARLVFNCITGVAICVVIYTAIRMMLAQGDEGAISEAKKMVAYAVAGIVLSMIAWAVVPFISLAVAEGFGSIAWAVIPLSCNF